MKTISLEVEDSFVDTLKVFLQGFIEQKKVQIIEEKQPSFIVNSKSEVQKRVQEAEQRIIQNGGVDEKTYNEMMESFFENELGLKR